VSLMEIARTDEMYSGSYFDTVPKLSPIYSSQELLQALSDDPLTGDHTDDKQYNNDSEDE